MGERENQGNPGRGGGMSKGTEARKSTVRAGTYKELLVPGGK